MSVRSEALKLSERQAAELIKSGLSPNDTAIKLRMTKRPEELKRRILIQVGEGKLLLSEIYFSIPEAKRQRYKSLHERVLEDLGEASGESLGKGDVKMTLGEFRLMLDAAGVKIQIQQSQDLQISGVVDDDFSMIDFQLYCLSKDSPYTDTYEFLRDLEMTLHRLIRKTLEQAFPKHDDDWWSKGISLETRKRCSAMQEEDADHHLEAYSYTNFIDFMKIIDRNKAKFREVLPMDLADDRKMAQLLKDLEGVNKIRNGVMHPIKGIPLLKAQCDFVRRLRDQLLGFRWRKPIGTA